MSLLEPYQIRGVDMKKPPYNPHENPYPKALTPPAVTVTDRHHEVELRAEWGIPLPYIGDEAAEHRESYFRKQSYPKAMIPPQVIVQNAEEEQRRLASWRVGGSPVEDAKWPQYRFHASLGGKMVNNADESEALGIGWFKTPIEAVEAAQQVWGSQAPGIRVFPEEGDETPLVDPEVERGELVAKAEQLGLKIHHKSGVDKIRAAVKHAEDAANYSSAA